VRRRWLAAWWMWSCALFGQLWWIMKEVGSGWSGGAASVAMSGKNGW